MLRSRIHIPKKMTNEESKLVAGAIVAEREYQLADAKFSNAMVRLAKYYQNMEGKAVE